MGIFSQRLSAQCALNETFTLSPQPVGGVYSPGQVVSVCYNVGSYQQNGANWIHGFVFQLGNGWDPSSLVITQFPNTCSGSGEWGLYNSVTGFQSGQTFGLGVYYDYANQFTAADGNPGNNFGDQNVNTACQWYMCFDIAVDSNCSGGDLSLGMMITGDGTSGSWNSPACPGITFPILSNVTCNQPCNYTVNTLSTNPSCANNNGSINLSISGGVAPFQYAWSNGATTTSINNLSVGIYNVTVTDATGCVKNASADLVINDSSGVNIQVVQNISCATYCDAELQATPAFGAAPYSYQWSNGTTTSNVNNLCSGFYSVTLTDANQCAAIDTLTLSNPSGLLTNITTQPASCFGFADGSASLNIQSILPVTNILWSPAGQISATATNLPAGNYSVVVTDVNGCSVVDSCVVTQPNKPTLSIFANDVSCFGANDASIMATASNGNGPYAYSWSNGETQSAISNLSSGIYWITATDVNNCSADSFSIVNEPTQITVNFDSHPAGCETAQDGFIAAEVYGGTPSYNYQWSNSPVNSNVLNNLSSGSYAITVTDASGCFIVDSTHVVAMPQFSVYAGFDVETAVGFPVTLNALVDVPGSYTYEWFPNQNITGQGLDQVEVQPDTTTVYTVVVTDINGCYASDDVKVDVLANVYISIPNAFSPNNDGYNNLFFPIPADRVVIQSFRVFDRWGRKVHDSLGVPGWDGTWEGHRCEMGLYTYYCEYTRPDGVETRAQGTVLLLR